jgi:hypothetical protein
VAAGPGLRKLALARVQRRGFKPIWITLDDLGVEDEPQGKSLDDKVAELASKRNAAGSLVIQWGPAPVDDIDTAHADEKRYVIHSSLRVRGISGLAVAKANTANSVPGKVEGRMELLENDSFETSAARLLTDEFTDLGGQTARIEAALGKSAGQPVEGDDSEVAIEISGVQDFAQLGRVKAQIQARLTNNSVEERKISRTHLTLAVPGEKSAETVKARLTGLDGVVITSAADGVIQMEARQ